MRGLGVVLYSISDGHSNMEMLFEQWGYSIVKQDVKEWFQAEDCSYIAKALALHRIGFRFFRVQFQFYFDGFYLTELFDKSLINKLNDFLIHHGCNVFTKSALKQISVFFRDQSNTVPKVERSLIQHRENNLKSSDEYESRVLVVATVSAGKSTLINAITGSCFNRVKTGVCTTRICKIHNKNVLDGITIKTGDLFSYYNDINRHSSSEAEEVGFHFESVLGSHRICLLDTPGVNNSKDEEHFQITSDAIKARNYDLIICISNCQYNGTDDERKLLNLLYSHADKPIIFVLNKLDRFKSSEDSISRMLKLYKEELRSIGFDTNLVFPLSAQYAYFLKNKSSLDDDEQDEFRQTSRIFAKVDYDLQRYTGKESKCELEKSGIVAVENAVIQHINII